MGEHAERIFVGWDEPFLAPAVRAWLAHVAQREIDTSRALIALPGRRAVRRTQELVAELAPASLPPPRVITDGELAFALSRERLLAANPFTRALAWREATSSLAAEERAVLWSARDAELAPATLARLCARTLSELWGEGCRAREIAGRASSSPAFGDPARWGVLALVEQRYGELLSRSGRIDPAEAAIVVRERALADETLSVSLFAVVDPSQATRRLLDGLGARVTSFVFAPRELAHEFDKLGCPLAANWSDRNLALSSERWRIVDTPDDQALAVLDELSARAKELAPSDVSIGVPDLDVLPALERRLAEAGCEPRWAGGTRLSQSRPAACIAALREWLVERRFEPYAALLRQPDLERVLARDAGLAPGDIPSALDAYAERRLPAFADGNWLGGSSADTQAIARAHAALLERVGAFATSTRLPLAAWADELAGLFAALWPVLEPASPDAERASLARALAAFAELIEEARESGSELALSADDALQLFFERSETKEVAPPPARGGRAVIELFGWLELALDDARELCLTGVNEGALPSGAGADAWLVERARCELGLAHEARRVTRDTWALSAILASRPRTLLISGRRNSRRDPLVPSRFVFRTEPANAVERVRRAWPRHETPRPFSPAPASAFVPARVATPQVSSISVTGFRDYLASPYLFYLRHVLRLRTLDDRKRELDGRDFGVLAHDVLAALGHRENELRDSDDPDALAAFLRAELALRAERTFGDRPQAAVRLQIEALHRRLARFARWQAEQAAEGWRIAHVEYDAQRTRIGRAGGELVLRGRIDRIDRNLDGRWRVLDYKTSNSSKPPRAMHLAKGAWIDLQLPLYRLIARELIPEGADVHDGYVQLDKSDTQEVLAVGKWEAEELDDALERANEIVELVQRGVFDEVGDTAPSEPIFAALCGFGLLRDDDGSDES